MATFNATSAADVVRSSVAATADQFERTFIVPSTAAGPLQLHSYGGGSHFAVAPHSAQPSMHQQATASSTSSSSYTFVQIKREPCQVSEVTTSNNCHQQLQHHHLSTSSATKSMSSSSSTSSTLTTLVKIEASSPKVTDMERHHHAQQTNTLTNAVPSTNNSVPIGIAVARKRPQESNNASSLATSASTLAQTNGSLNSLSLQQQTLNKDLNCYGIRVADLGGVGNGCGNIYFTGNGDLMTGSSTTAEELALNAAAAAAGVQSINRAAAQSTFWQYPNALPIESVISMSPATVGLQYSREPSRGQVVLLPATAAALDPFQPAAAFVWPSYIPQSTTSSAAAAAPAAALQPPPNFIFPSMSPHSTLQSQPYATSLQLFGSNYLTAAAAAAAAAAATTTLCQHSQQQQSSSSTSTPGGGGSTTINLSTTSASSTSSRFVSLAPASQMAAQVHTKSMSATSSLPLPLTMPPLAPNNQLPLLLPPTALKIEDCHGNEYVSAKNSSMSSSAFQQQHNIMAGNLSLTLPLPNSAAAAAPHVLSAANAESMAAFDLRDKLHASSVNGSSAASNLMELQANGSQALNLMRLPTPPTSATLETAAVAAASPQIQHGQPLLFTTTTTEAAVGHSNSSTPSLLNLSTSLPRAASVNTDTNTFLAGATVIGPPTPGGDENSLSFKSNIAVEQQHIVVGVPRMVSASSCSLNPPPQMQDVNIQTDTPVCSEDENSSCPLMQQTNGQEEVENQPLELTKNAESVEAAEPSNKAAAVQSSPRDAEQECHNKEEEEDETNQNKAIKATEEPNESLIQFNQQFCVTSATAVSNEAAFNEINTTPRPQGAEELSGLELLSQLTSTLEAKPAAIVPLLRVKQEPQDCSDSMLNNHQMPTEAEVNTNPVAATAMAEPFGGLSLLCALAEQRLQEDVQSSEGIFNRCNDSNEEMSCSNFSSFHPAQNHNTPTPPSFRYESTVNGSACFPSMEGIELPSTGVVGTETPTKRKKHKHSKSTKSATASLMGSSKKSSSLGSSQKGLKKNKKKMAKEKRKHRQLLEDARLQEELNSVVNSMNPNFRGAPANYEAPGMAAGMDAAKLPELFNMMSKRLADITRQYRKKKRKLDEISAKNKKKKKCSKLAAAAANMVASPLAEYNNSGFGKFSSGAGASSSSTYLQPSSFARCFAEKSCSSSNSHSFPPAAELTDQHNEEPDEDSVEHNIHHRSPSLMYKTVRLEPSALDHSLNSTGLLRHASKHAASDSPSASMLVPSKERKLMTPIKPKQERLNGSKTEISKSSSKKTKRKASSLPKVTTSAQHNVNAQDCQLMLTSEHLFRNETRVLTDMGGLFYAGILKPLQPPDVYAITLDGERGNKPHIMSREEIFKDTILELAPKNIESVPVGTRLCAYWSQQYRCLYPGRAIESESSEDDSQQVNDFVSVEFDDGDSGRIRLQNIRLLLSDYPIVEYNDNPLYSLGKQKKSNYKSDNQSDNQQHDHSSSAAEDHHQQHSLGMSINAVNGSTTSELQQSAIDRFNQRSEKKRIKSLKKKSSQAAAAATAAGSTDAANRKHHKHKKRKKHKKHHHREINSNKAEANNCNAGFMARVTSTPTFVGKSERDVDDEDNEDDDDADVDNDDYSPNHCDEDGDQENDNEIITEDAKQPLMHSFNGSGKGTAAIKVEVTTPPGIGHSSSNIKVKTEHLEMEEETNSNLMSETSEIKGDDDAEVEHNNSKGSKIAAFLPDRQLWGWMGTAYRKAGNKGRARKQFYKSIKRGKEIITVGDCAVFLSTGRPDRPYIGRIESMWETASSNKVVRVRWFYHPEETTGCPDLKFPGGLFESPHEDENDVQTISHRCEVLPFMGYFGKFGADSKQYQLIYDNNDTYYLAGFYNPRLQVLKLHDDIPTLEEEPQTTLTTITKNNINNSTLNNDTNQV